MEDTAASASPDSHREESRTPEYIILLGTSCVTLENRKQADGVLRKRAAGSLIAKE